MKRSTFILLLAIMLLSYFYGLATIHFKVFPYKFLYRITSIDAIGKNNKTIYYNHKKSFFDVNKTSNAEIVFVGDSLTDHVDWQELYPGQSILNRGINGDTTQGVLSRIDSILSTNAKSIFILLGINDIAKRVPLDLIVENYKKIIVELIENDINVFIQSTLYVGKEKSHLNPKIQKLNNELELFSYTHPLINYIDINKFVSPQGYLEPKYSLDGLHLNGDGYLQWQIALTDYVSTR